MFKTDILKFPIKTIIIIYRIKTLINRTTLLLIITDYLFPRLILVQMNKMANLLPIDPLLFLKAIKIKKMRRKKKMPKYRAAIAKNQNA